MYSNQTILWFLLVERYNQKFSGTCKLWCRDPLAVKWEVIPQSFYVNTLAEIGE